MGDREPSLDAQLPAGSQESRYGAPAGGALFGEMRCKLPRVVAPAGGAQLSVTCDGLLPKIIWQRDQLLNVLRQGLNQQHPRVRDRRAAVLTREGERRRGEARRQAPSGPVHLQPDAVQIIELHVRPRDERRRISEA